MIRLTFPSFLTHLRTRARLFVRRFAACVGRTGTAVRDVSRDVSRGGTLLVICLVALWLIATPNPVLANTNAVKIGMLAWLVCKESGLAYIGYWIDRLLHPHSRPGDLKDIERMAAEKRRVFLLCSLLLAGGLSP